MKFDSLNIGGLYSFRLHTYLFALGAQGKKRFQLYFVHPFDTAVFREPLSWESISYSLYRWFFFEARTAVRNDWFRPLYNSPSKAELYIS